MKYIFFILCLLLPALVFADIYMLTDKNGNIIYTDTPDKEAKKIDISAPPLHDLPVTPPPDDNIKPSTLDTTVQKKPYRVFEISSPLNEETVRNIPDIKISLKIEPSLQTGDKVQIFVDDKPAGNAVESTQISIGHPDRGIHKVKAVIIDANQQILKISSSITIYVHYGIANQTS